jgi:hypothetical protein
MGLIRVDYSSGPRLRLHSFVAAAFSGDLRVDPFWRRENHVTSGAWREEALHGAGLVGIGIPISHLLHRRRRGQVLEKDWIPTGNSDESVVEFEHLRLQMARGVSRRTARARLRVVSIFRQN